MDNQLVKSFKGTILTLLIDKAARPYGPFRGVHGLSSTQINSLGGVKIKWILWVIVALVLSLKDQVRAQATGSTQLELTKLVDKSMASLGDQLTYKLIVTNKSNADASNIIVRDSSSTGLRFVAGSATPPPATTFTLGTPVSIWTVATLSAGQSLTLTFQSVVDSSGVLYSRATIPGDTAVACSSIPIHVCTGDQYTFQLTAAPGRTSYKWFRNDVEITGQTTNVLYVTAPGTYSLAVDNVSGNCPDFSCCPFIVIEDSLPDYQVKAVSATCSTDPLANGQIILSNFNPAHTYQYSAGDTFNDQASRSGGAKTIPDSGVLTNNLPNPASSTAYTVRVYNGSECYIDQTVTLLPAACCSLSAVTTAGPCASATNTYSSTTVITVTNPTAGTLTVTDGPASVTFITTATPINSFTALFTGLMANGSSHTVMVALPGCSTLNTLYTAPISCSAEPMPSMALSLTPGSCQSGTNTYSTTGIISLTNAVEGTLHLVDGTATYSLSISAGTTSVPYSLSGLTPGTGVHTVTVTYAGQTASTTYRAPESCSACVPPVITVANSSQTLCSDGTPRPFSASITSGMATSFAWYGPLNSTTGVLGTAISGEISNAYQPGSNQLAGTSYYAVVVQGESPNCTTIEYSSLTINPRPVLKPLPGTVCSGQPIDILTSFSITNGSATLAVYSSLADLTNTTNTLTTTIVSLSATTTYFISLTNADGCTWQDEITVVVNPKPSAGQNQTLVCSQGGAPTSTTLLATHATGGVWSASTNNPARVSFSRASEVNTTVSGLTSTGTYTFVFTATEGCRDTLTVTVPACPCSLALAVTPGPCATATNDYSLTGMITLVNTPAGSLTITDGVVTAVVSASADQSSVPFSLSGLVSGSASHTVTILASTTACNMASTTYEAPASCTETTPTTIALTVTPGVCQPITNTYSVSGIISLTNAVGSTALITDGLVTTTVTITAGAVQVPFSLTGLTSGTGFHTVTVSYTGQTTSLSYTAPLSCPEVAPCSLTATTTAGLCAIATNTYSSTVLVTINNPMTGLLTVTDGTHSLTTAISAARSTVIYPIIFTEMASDGRVHTVSASLPGCAVITYDYTAPVSCSVGLALTITDPGSCQPATNTYTATGTLSLTNAVTGLATLTDGTITTTLSITAGQPTATYSLTGLSTGTGTHTVRVTYATTTVSTTYSAPESCRLAPCGLTMTLTPEPCQPATNRYQLSGTLTAANTPLSGTVTISSASFSDQYLLLPATTSTTAFSYSGLVSNGQTYTLTATASNSACAPISQTFTAPGSCSVTPVCSLSALVRPGICASTTNTYSASVVITLTNAASGNLTVSLPGSALLSQLISTTATSLTILLDKLPSDGMSHTATITLPGCGTASATFTAPESCSITPLCSVSATARAVAATCLGALPQANGQLLLSNFMASYTYQYSQGASFSEKESLSGPAKLIPADGLLVRDLNNPVAAQPYTIRIYDGNGCSTDMTVLLNPASCICSVDVCVPFMIRQTKRGVRKGGL